MRESCALLSSPFTLHPRKKYEEFLELVSHEFFHLWNVKRIHPEALGPFDYQREAYTRSLWVMEGVTSYYDRHLLVRAGLQKPDKYLEKLAEELGKIAAIPGPPAAVARGVELRRLDQALSPRREHASTRPSRTT